MIHQQILTVGPWARGLHDITPAISAAVRDAAPRGPALCSLFLQHTSASLLIQESADPDVRRDLETFMAGLVPDGDPRFVHTAEGPDDMPAHVRAALTATALTIPARDGRLLLGTWQGVYLYEHRLQPRSRRVVLTLCIG